MDVHSVGFLENWGFGDFQCLKSNPNEPQQPIETSHLEPYPLRTVAAAMQAYRDENGEFAPVPAGIAKRCKLMDGRPGAEEAWAIALIGQDEMASVVWTTEIAEAFRICRPVLGSSGAISARKPFLEAYERIVAAARLERRPAEWLAVVECGGCKALNS